MAEARPAWRALHARLARLRHLTLGVRGRLYIGIGASRRHLRVGVLRWIGILFVFAADIRAGIFVINRRDHLKWILLVRRCDPGQLRFEFAFIHRERSLEYARRDWSRDRSTVLSALHHYRDDVFRVVIGSETAKPRDRIFFPVGHGLRRAGFAGDNDVFQTRSAASAAIFIHNFPQTAPGQFDLLRSEIVT